MNYRDNWTDDRLPLWLPHIQHLIGAPRSVTALEIGCYEGRSTVWMCEHILTHPTSQIICIDPFKSNPSFEGFADYLPRFVENTTLYRDKIKIVQAFTKDLDSLAPFLFVDKYDLIYIDGSHATEDVLGDARSVMPLCKPGTIIAFDDAIWDSVRAALDVWLKEVGKRVQVVHQEYQLIAQVIQ